MKRSFSLSIRPTVIVLVGTGFIAATYGLVRLAFGLFLPDIERDLGLGATVAGYLAAGSSLAYCAAAAIGFALGGRVPRTLIVAAAVTACGGVWGMAGAHGVGAFGTWAVISSAGAGFASPALVAVVTRNVGVDHADSAQSVVNAGTGPGLIGAGLLALFLLPSWRLSWLLVGILTAVVAVSLLVADRPGRGSPPPGDRPDRPPIGWVRAHRTAVVAAMLMGAGSSAVWTYGRSVLVAAGSGDGRGTVVAWIVLGVGGAAAIVTARPLATPAPPHAWAVSCSAVTCAVVLLALLPAHTSVALGACLIFGWGYTAGTSALIAWSAAIDRAHAAAGTAMLFVALVLGQAAGAAVLGLTIGAAGSRTAFLVAAGVSAAAVAITVWRPRSDPTGPTGATPAADARSPRAHPATPAADRPCGGP